MKYILTFLVALTVVCMLIVTTCKKQYEHEPTLGDIDNYKNKVFEITNYGKGTSYFGHDAVTIIQFKDHADTLVYDSANYKKLVEYKIIRLHDGEKILPSWAKVQYKKDTTFVIVPTGGKQ